MADHFIWAKSFPKRWRCVPRSILPIPNRGKPPIQKSVQLAEDCKMTARYTPGGAPRERILNFDPAFPVHSEVYKMWKENCNGVYRTKHCDGQHPMMEFPINPIISTFQKKIFWCKKNQWGIRAWWRRQRRLICYWPATWDQRCV